MARQKHKPQRTCIACRTTKDKQTLIRIVRTTEKTISFDPTGKANGRGIYICRQKKCLKKGLQKKILTHTLQTSLSDEELKRLREQLQAEISKL